MDKLDFKALPKIELHAHLTGSVSRQTLHQIWQRKKAASETDLQDPLEVMPLDQHNYNLETFFPLFSSYIYNLLTDETSLREATAALLLDFLQDGVVYLELRTTPRSTPHLTPSQYVSTILSAISQFEASYPEMHTRLILSIDRRHDLPTATRVVDLALEHNRPGSLHGIVGLDLCGDPTAGLDGKLALFTPLFEKAKQVGLGITLHCAEAKESATDEELDILLGWQPDRLGHVIWESDAAKEEITRRGLGLELCVSCNVNAGMGKGKEFGEHHFGYWWNERKGGSAVKISLSTDDVGVFGSPLSNEYQIVAQHFALDRREICDLARQPIETIFGGEEEKQRLRDLMWRF